MLLNLFLFRGIIVRREKGLGGREEEIAFAFGYCPVLGSVKRKRKQPRRREIYRESQN